MRYKKSIMAGVLSLSMIVGAGAASAASYTVAGNDTLWAISKKYGIDLNSLIQANSRVYNPNIIWQGMRLTIPRSNSGTGFGVPQPTAPQPTVPQPKVPQSTVPQPTGGSTSVSAFASQVFTMVNQERAKAGLNALVSDGPLSDMAMAKAKDMYNNHYFDHTSPTYGSPFNMMTTFGIRYSYAGENIAMGQRSPQEVMTSWMNSPGHRQNILSPNYKKIGVAYYNGEWVQEFIAN